jgi:hypothetical protein
MHTRVGACRQTCQLGSRRDGPHSLCRAGSCISLADKRGQLPSMDTVAGEFQADGERERYRANVQCQGWLAVMSTARSKKGQTRVRA